MYKKNNKISPCYFTIPTPPQEARDNFCTARHRRYNVVKTVHGMDKLKKAKNTLSHMENINTLVQFGQVIGAIVLIL